MASTISQQLAKMLFPREDLNTFQLVLRKFQEWVIAARIERLYTKDEVIALYLNRFDWINQAVGINSASRVYFNTTPDSLRIEEAAMLVGMLKNPSLFNPLRRPGYHDASPHGGAVPNEEGGLPRAQQYDSLRRRCPSASVSNAWTIPKDLLRISARSLRSQLQALFSAKDEDGKYLIAKADGSPYDIYTDGLKVYTTLDRRMQSLCRVRGEGAPFHRAATGLLEGPCPQEEPAVRLPRDARQEIDGIMNTAMKRSMRYRIMIGKQCGNCERPAKYIEKVKKDGVPALPLRPAQGRMRHLLARCK